MTSVGSARELSAHAAVQERVRLGSAVFFVVLVGASGASAQSSADLSDPTSAPTSAESVSASRAASSVDPSEVHRLLVEDPPESAWSGMPRLPTAEVLARIARDADEELELRVRAVVTLGEVFHYVRGALESLRPLACADDVPASLAEATRSAIDPGRAPDPSWCRDDESPRARPTFGGVVAGWLYGSFGFGLDRRDPVTGEINGGGFALGAGAGVEVGLRVEDVSLRLAAHATSAFLGSSQSRWFAAMGPLLLVDVILEPGLHFAAGGGFDWGQSALFDDSGMNLVQGFFPALHLRTIVVDGELAVGAMLHFFLPVERPELFGLTIGLTVGAHTRE